MYLKDTVDDFYLAGRDEMVPVFWDKEHAQDYPDEVIDKVKAYCESRMGKDRLYKSYE